MSRPADRPRILLPLAVSLIVNGTLVFAAINLASAPEPAANAGIVVELEQPVKIQTPAPKPEERPAIKIRKPEPVKRIKPRIEPEPARTAKIPRPAQQVRPERQQPPISSIISTAVSHSAFPSPSVGPGAGFESTPGPGEVFEDTGDSKTGRAGPRAADTSDSGFKENVSGGGKDSYDSASGTTDRIDRNVSILSQTRPPYPESAREEGVQGTATLVVSVDENGRPSNVKVERSAGDRRLDKAAIESVKTWKFSPKITDGAAAASSVKVNVQFRLD